MITIHDYQPSWPGEFERIQTELQSILGSDALRIDHIGSTSVPGLSAKDIIDVQITVADLAPGIGEKLATAGYRLQPDYVRDHTPHGEDPDPKLWQKMVFVEPEGRRRANIHVRIAGNPNQRYALLFRDYLRAHPNAARSVERVKRALARLHPDDPDAYYAVKDPVYDLIWVAAQDWARRAGWNQT